MIYVLTVHWKFDFWVDAQVSRLRKYIREPFKIFAFCDGTRRDHSRRFDYCATSKGVVDHPSKLNALADVACATAGDDDILVFCDSDAFPIGDITAFLRDQLERWPLVAVQRLENAGDPQPHPCFTITTAGLWRRIAGDWRPGPTWTNTYGNVVTDVGAHVLEALDRHAIEWGKMHRSNRVNLHPLLFAIYGDLVYHHGAGSRPTVGGRGMRHGELTGLDLAERHQKAKELRKSIADASRVVLDILSRDRDAELRALLG